MARRFPAISRKQIVDSLTALATELGRSPSKIEFQARSGIKQRPLEMHFESWNDALAAANLPPNIVKTNSAIELLDDWGTVTRALGRCPQYKEYQPQGKFGAAVFRRRFNSWPGVGRAFYSQYIDEPQWQDVIEIIRVRESRGIRPWLISPDFQITRVAKAPLSAPTDITYGEPIDFELLRNAPVNEAGVVYLFGCMAHRLGFIVEAIQTNFPDCEAKRKGADGRLRRLRIEFEFESRNFLLHKHDTAACDVIVCWRDNWSDCPIEVIDLSKHVAALSKDAKNQSAPASNPSTNSAPTNSATSSVVPTSPAPTKSAA